MGIMNKPRVYASLEGKKVREHFLWMCRIFFFFFCWRPKYEGLDFLRLRLRAADAIYHGIFFVGEGGGVLLYHD